MRGELSHYAGAEVLTCRIDHALSVTLTAEAVRRQTSRPDLVRQILNDAVQSEVWRLPRIVAAAPGETLQPKAKEARPTALQLFERGHTAQQIAAMLRLPYREVLSLVGRAVDNRAAVRKALGVGE